ncbi:MAG TPA: class II fructose-bisphosphate aldolase [Isosphaeraceae bacterium]|nr:class II fructose-bisphosphate aldolase [Isosphaeraceae bacterium]
MPLAAIGPMMRRAVDEGYAVGYFESWNLESLQGVVDAAEATGSPVILGFNGDFLSRPSRRAAERLAWYAALGRAAAESAAVPCGLIFNECPRDDWVRAAIEAGFNLVMPADPEAAVGEATRRVGALARLAHARGVAVEAELGELPYGAAGGPPRGGSATDPEAAAAFVAATGVDLLAVSVGNVHIQTHGEAPLDLERLAEIRRRVAVPMVLHGGTGIAAADLRAAITLGVAKVNYGTYLKQRYLHAVRAAIGRDAPDPHRLLGMGGPEDALIAGRHAVRDAVLERIGLLGCCGKANTDRAMPQAATRPAGESSIRIRNGD